MHKIEIPGQLERYADVLEKLGQKCGSTEAVAVDALNYLYNRLNEGVDEPCALVRFFRTMSFDELTPELKKVARQNLKTEQEKTVNCLTLLASRGMLPEWNDRFESVHHQVIPLVSSQMVAAAPMIAQLIDRLDIEVAQVVSPAPNLFLNPREKAYNVLYVPEALGDTSIVAQQTFVSPHKIRSVIGFGGLLPTGDMFAVMMFMRIFVSAKAAKRFSILASALELAINSVRSGKKTNARILIATESEVADRLQALLGGEHALVKVNTIEQALSAARTEIFDLIICGVLFDESRMFELLQAVKANKLQKPKPFICFKHGRSGLGAGIDIGVAYAAQLIGANCYLDSAGMNDQELLDALQAYLPEEIWMDGSRRN
jgi:CheY-like chemotaxis protein